MITNKIVSFEEVRLFYIWKRKVETIVTNYKLLLLSHQNSDLLLPKLKLCGIFHRVSGPHGTHF